MEASMVHVLCALLWVFLCAHVVSCGSEAAVNSAKKVVSVTFLVTVNDTWYPEEYNKTCLQTVKSPPLRPNGKWNESETIHVGNCDYGPLIFTVNPELTVGEQGEKESHTYVSVTFYSHVIEDASHPACRILWDYKYREPTTIGPQDQSLLPGCFVMDSREGYHMTYYWFHILDWMLA